MSSSIFVSSFAPHCTFLAKPDKCLVGFLKSCLQCSAALAKRVPKGGCLPCMRAVNSWLKLALGSLLHGSDAGE